MVLYFPDIRIVMTDLYESEQGNFEIGRFYAKKIMKWIMRGDYDDLIKYLKVVNGKVEVGRDSANSKSDRKLKAKFIESKFLSTTDGIINLVDTIKSKANMSSYDFKFNHEFVKDIIKSIMKSKIKRYL